jgi:oligoribonuclease
MVKEKFKPTKFLWLDLEMTGLIADKDLILEVAAEVTGTDLGTLGSYESNVKHEREEVLRRMQENSWWKDYPDNRDYFVNGLGSAKPLKEVEKDLVSFVEQHFGNEQVVLAGNSIQSDRAFIKQWMPELELKLHYRMLDVTSWKIVMETMHDVTFEKPEVHRAYEDIQASIAELQYYLDWFAKNERN